jgi:hypothetical protein
MKCGLGESIVGAEALAEIIARPLLVTAKASRRVELISCDGAAASMEVLMTVMGIPTRDWVGMAGWVGMIAASNDPTHRCQCWWWWNERDGGRRVLSALMQPKIQSRPRGCPVHAQPGTVDRMMNEAMGQAQKCRLRKGRRRR